MATYLEQFLHCTDLLLQLHKHLLELLFHRLLAILGNSSTHATFAFRSSVQKTALITPTAATIVNLTQVVHTLLPLSPSSTIWYQRKLRSKQAYHVVHRPVSRGLAVFTDAWLSGWLAEISADLRETVAH